MSAEPIYHQQAWIQNFPFLGTFSPPPLLQELHLRGNLIELPNWFVSMKNLTILILFESSLSEDSSTVLQLLPKLKCLRLKNVYNTKCIGKEFCIAGGFPKLELFEIK